MKSAAPQLSQQAPESLRERKKRLTREAIFAAAQALFTERGFDDVTVAEIADAANISVKTLFTYISAKDELLF
ncbi:MAG TPA: helix-turn-helix domain-containing protein, partial [Streptosporangiaceae bacterium]